MISPPPVRRVEQPSATSTTSYSCLIFGPFLPRDHDASGDRLLAFLSSRAARSLRRVLDPATGKYRSMRGSAYDCARQLITFSDAVGARELSTELDTREPSVYPIEIVIADSFIGFRTLENAGEMVSAILAAIYGVVVSGPVPPLPLSTVRVEAGALRIVPREALSHSFHCETFTVLDAPSHADVLTVPMLRALREVSSKVQPAVTITHLPPNPLHDLLPWSSSETRHQFCSRFSDVPLGLNITTARNGTAVSVSVVDDSELVDVHQFFSALAIEMRVSRRDVW